MPKVSDEHLAGRRRQILEAAAGCFARNGFHRTSMQDIVKESGLSAGLIYRYFDGKDDMILAIVGEWHTSRAAGLRTGDDPFAAYLGLLKEIAGPDAALRRNLGLQAWAETVREPRIRALARQGVDDQREAFKDIAPDAVIRVLVAIYQGLLLQVSWDDDLDAEAFVAAVRELVRRPASAAD
ncbi:TetR/AcrR family transcriptional regulator [Amycolatopsis vancoresmycina]|uniref:TetR/AcrR family transcriptional regulator n=1 Tax=Amycolatopsis vancoresmycina TaxID=208444 RepID=UPI000526B816|nr:TetR/AcrR family transcriptional regulator [Amycolatopsis vancoresmycina]